MSRYMIGLGVLLAQTASAQPAAPAQAPCITDFSRAQDVALAGNAVRFCDDRRQKKKSCFSVDLATGKLATAPVPAPAPVPTTGPNVDINGKTAKVCKPDGTRCRTLRPKAYVDEMLVMTGAANAAGTVAALANTTEIETFDLTTGKRIAGFKAGSGACTWIRFLGDDTLLVQNVECGEERGTSWLATPRGKRIAAIGGDQPVDALGSVALGSRAAFASVTGDVIVVQDVKTGKVERRIAVGAPADDARPALVGDEARLAIVFGGERWGDVAVVDLASDKVTTHVAKRCPK